MTPTLLISLLAGAVVAGGVWAIVVAVVPGPPALGAALARMTGQDQPPPVEVPAGAPLKTRVGAKVAARVRIPSTRLTPTRADLDITGTDPHALLGEKTLAAAVGIVMPAVITALLLSSGVPVPAGVLVVVGAIFCVGGWFAPDIDTTRRAKAARDELDRAVAALLEMVAVQRLSGAGVAQALKEAAAAAHSWPFRRVDEAIAVGELDGRPPWDALDQLADQLADPNRPERTQALRDAAAICRHAAQSGAEVADQLAGLARAMRGVQASADLGEDNKASTTMTVPMTLTLGVVGLAIMAPIAWQMLTGGALR